MTLAIETKGLARRFGDVRAVDGLDLHVEKGTFYGFLGPNGAGKSTTIKMLTGLLAPTAGTMHILGQDLSEADGAREMRRRIGVVPEQLALFDNLTAREYLTFVGRMYWLPIATVLLLSMYGNLLSVFVPHRISAGSLKPTKMSSTQQLLLMLSFFLFPVVSVPVFFPALLALALSWRHGPLAALLMLLFSTLELMALAVLYRLSLPRFGVLLQRREQQILQVVTREVE